MRGVPDIQGVRMSFVSPGDRSIGVVGDELPMIDPCTRSAVSFMKRCAGAYAFQAKNSIAMIAIATNAVFRAGLILYCPIWHAIP